MLEKQDLSPDDSLYRSYTENWPCSAASALRVTIILGMQPKAFSSQQSIHSCTTNRLLVFWLTKHSTEEVGIDIGERSPLLKYFQSLDHTPMYHTHFK